MKKNLVVQGKIRDYTSCYVMDSPLNQYKDPYIQTPVFYGLHSISPSSIEPKVGFHPSFTLGSFLQRRGGSKWDMKIHPKKHHVSD